MQVVNERRKAAVAWLSVISNAALVIVKIIIGLIIGSVSVISEAIHSGVDLVAACIALFAVKNASKPADKDHPFGHGKFENISGTVEAILIFLAAGWIIYAAIKKFLHPVPMETASLGVLVMFLSAIINIIVSHFLFKIGKETHSVALLGDAWHLRTDVYTSLGVMVGLAVILGGGKLAPTINLQWVDPAAAIIVALLILRAAYVLTVQSARDLLDVSLPPDEEQWIRGCIMSFSPALKGYHRLRTRKSGPYRFVEFHMIVDSEMSVLSAHRLADELTQSLKDHFPETNVLVHIEPCDGRCPPSCAEGCMLTQDERDLKQQHSNF